MGNAVSGLAKAEPGPRADREARATGKHEKQSTSEHHQPAGGLAFRVRGVPLGWDVDALQSFLADQDSSASPTIRSLADENHGRSRTATISFINLPHQLRTSKTGHSWQISLPASSAHSARPQSLALDDGFLGLTTLYIPPHQEHKVDLIAISGLGGHAFGSFKERGGEHMWLRDALPHDITGEIDGNPIARVMIFGYESSLPNSQSIQNLEDLGTAFHSSLLGLASAATPRPIIFIAHSLGGLIVKQTLISLSKSKSKDDQKLVQAVYGIVFFGVPHDGMDIGSLIPMVGNAPNRFLLESIGHINSQILSIQQREFHKSLGGEGESEVVCFYETVKSPTAMQDERGKWHMNGPATVLVTKYSATHCRPWEDGPEHISAINRTHSEMVKFGPEDHEYERALLRIKSLVRRALSMRQEIGDSLGALPENVGSAGTKILNDVDSSGQVPPFSHWIVPFGRNDSFVGHESPLQQLLERIPPKANRGNCQRTAIEGLGGVGKTQIALEAAFRVRENHPDCSVFWVPAVDATSFENAYRKIGQELNVKGLDDDKTDVKLLVKAALSECISDWLLIVDNADDIELLFGNPGLSDYFPCSPKGSILFTTRNHDVVVRLDIPRRNLIRAKEMTSAEALQLLQMNLEEEQTSHAESTTKLLDFLTNLPLAIRQASMFMAKTGISTTKYLDHCLSSNKRVIQLLSTDFEDQNRYKKSRDGVQTIKNAVATTWLISFENISRDNPLAAQYLRFMCFLAEKEIPASLLPKVDDELEADEAIGTLKAYAFITQRKEQDTYDIHLLVRLSMLNWLTMKGEWQESAAKALRRLIDVFPRPNYENRSVWMSYLPHTQYVLRTREEIGDKIAGRDLLFNVAESFHILGKYREAETLHLEALKLRKKELGEMHPDTLSSMNNLARVFNNQGRYDESEQMHRQTLELRDRVLGREHPHTLTSMNNLANVLHQLGKLDESEQMHFNTLWLREKVLDKEHPDTLDSMNNLASVLRSRGKYKEGEQMLQQTLEIKENVLGKEHNDTLISRSNLANILRYQGKYDEAGQMHKTILDWRKSTLGVEHPATLSSMNNIALVLQQQGNYEEAEKMHRQTLGFRIKMLCEDHPDTLQSMVNLAIVLQEQGKHEEAERLHRKTLNSKELVLGKSHPSTLTSMNGLANVLQSQGKYEEAEKIHRLALELREKTLGGEHPDTLSSMNNLANVLHQRGSFEEAERMLRQALELMEKVLGKEHPDTLSSLNNLAEIFRYRGKYDEAEKMHWQTLELREKVLGIEHPDTVKSVNSHANVLQLKQKHKAAGNVPNDKSTHLLHLIGMAMQATQEINAGVDEAEDGEVFPNAFHEALKHLPLIQETLGYAEKCISGSNSDEQFCQIMKRLVRDYESKATRMAEVFYDVVYESDTSRMERYHDTAGRENTIEVLMMEMLKSMVDILEHLESDSANESHLALKKAIEEVSKLLPPLPVELSLSYINVGAGVQMNNTGAGAHFAGVAYAYTEQRR